MSTATKAAAATGSVAGGGLAGAAMAGAFSSDSPKPQTTSITIPQDKQTTPQEDTPPPPIGKPTVTEIVWSPLSLEMISPDNTYSGKIGSEYKHLLTGPYGPTGSSNKNWWNKQLEKYNTDKNSNSNNLSDEFAKDKVTSGFAEKAATTNDPDKALNKVCDSVYQQDTTKIKHEKTKPETENTFKLKKDLWKYCSDLETPPKTVEDAPADGENYDGTAYGETKKSELLSVKEGVNKLLWDLKQKEFFALSKVDDEFFKELFNSQDKTKNNALRDKCKDAYKKTAANANTAPSDENTVKYCSAKAMS